MSPPAPIDIADGVDVADTNADAAPRARAPSPPGPGFLLRLTYLLRFRFGGDKERILDELLDRYGPVTRIDPFVLLSGPAANRLLAASGPDRVVTWANEDFPSLASSDGDGHVRHRKLVMEAFQARAFTGYLPAIRDAIAQRADAWRGRVDLHAEMKELALELLLRTMLGIAPGSGRAQAFLRHYWPLIHRADPSWTPWLQRRRVRRAKTAMWSLLRELIAERRCSPGDDALSQLVAASEAAPDGPLGDDDLVRYAYMLMDFGHGDLAIYLTYALALAAAHPELLNELRAEHAATYSDAAAVALERHLPLTLNFLREIERRYPPVTDLHRTASADLTFEGYHIPKGAFLVSALQRAHLSPAVFANPLSFDPTRFAPPREEHRTSYALLGFGAGRHMCVAAAYSRVVAGVALHEISLRRRPRKAGGTGLPEIDYREVLQRPREPVYLDVGR